jgi:leucyl-tRNA synthetase
LAIQVNGKVRHHADVSIDASQEEIQEQVMGLERIQELVSGKQIVKVIVIPKKLVNIVVK